MSLAALYAQFSVSARGSPARMFRFNGLPCPNEIMIGDPKKRCVMFTGSNFGLQQLSNFFPPAIVASTGKLITQTNPSCLINRRGCEIDRRSPLICV